MIVFVTGYINYLSPDLLYATPFGDIYDNVTGPHYLLDVMGLSDTANKKNKIIKINYSLIKNKKI